MIDPLLIPLSRLPGPCPTGAPVCCSVEDGEPGYLLTIDHDAGEVLWVHRDGGWLVYSDPIDRMLLDLRCPPVDGDGWPTRIDGFDLAFYLWCRMDSGDRVPADTPTRRLLENARTCRVAGLSDRHVLARALMGGP